MSVVAGSRYEGQPIYRVPVSNDTYRVAIYPQGYFPQSFSFRSHEVQPFERLDHIADTYFNDPEMWWVIAAVNPELEYQDDIEPGTVLRIPG